MDTKALHDSTVSIIDGGLGGSSNYTGLVKVSSTNGDAMQELKRARELMIQVEMDIACSSEKICNLGILMMHVAARENDLEAFDNEEDDLIDSAEKVLEFDFLSEIIYSTVGELGYLMTRLYNEIISTHEVTSLCKHMREDFHEIQDKLQCAEETVKQSQEHISDMKKQSIMFRRSLVNFSREDNSNEKYKELNIIENGNFPLSNAKVEMQTSEQQRNILRMLEKSLATELDLEQKLTESKQAEDELKMRLLLSERGVTHLEEQMTSQFQRLFEAETAADVFKGVSVELVGQLQSCLFDLKCALMREAELSSKIESNTVAFNSENGKMIAVVKDKLATADSAGGGTAAELKLLEEANSQLKEELETLNSDKSHLTELVQLLKRRLTEADIQLQQGVASVEASKEKQGMLCSSIKEMEIEIDSLKGKVTKADERADEAEDKWILLSESNTELNDEVIFLRGRLECLEASLNQSEEGKAVIIKDINVQTKVITDLVTQLEMERENLYKQASSLMKEKQILMDMVLHDIQKNTPILMSNNVRKLDGLKETGKNNSSREIVADADTPSITDVQPTLRNVHSIDVGRLGFKHAIVAMFVGLISIVAMCYWRRHFGDTVI